MGFGVADVKRFGGLQLSTDPADVGLERALAGSNFDVDMAGSYVCVRDGLVSLATLAHPATSAIVLRSSDPSDSRLMVMSEQSGEFYLEGVSPSGVVSALGNWTDSIGTPSNGHHSMVAYGDPAASSVFIASGKRAQLRRWTGGVLSTLTGRPRYVGVSPTSNRLIQGHYNNPGADSPVGVLGTVSTVYFSDAGAPTTFGANNYVHLHPGDGEELRGIVNWRGQTFVFKQTKVFIFPGESLSSTGTPVFDYRAVPLDGAIGSGYDDLANRLYDPVVAAGTAGVYFVTATGVHRTTGGPPVRISTAIDAKFTAGITAGHSAPGTLSVEGLRVYLHRDTETLVYDERSGVWTSWVSAKGLPIEMTRFGSLMWVTGTGVYYMSPTVSADAGSAIVSSYQTGFSDLGAPSVKTVRQLQAWGSGAPTLSIGVDYAAPDTGSAVTLGTAPAVDDAIQATSRRGTTFSVKVAAASGAWKIDNVALHVRRPRSPGAKP